MSGPRAPDAGHARIRLRGSAGFYGNGALAVILNLSISLSGRNYPVTNKQFLILTH